MKSNNKELPCEECGGECCKYAPIETKIWERVKDKLPQKADVTCHWKGTKKEAYIAMKPDSDGVCAFLVNGRCSIYYIRPRSCRAVGTILPCAYVDPSATLKYIEAARATGHKFVADIIGEKK